MLQIDMSTRQVITVAGNGQKGNDYAGGRQGKNQQLNSPWDLVFDSKVGYYYKHSSTTAKLEVIVAKESSFMWMKSKMYSDDVA